MKFPRPSQEEISVNLTPLIDVVFLLLIFFMVSTTFDDKTQLSITFRKPMALRRLRWMIKLK